MYDLYYIRNVTLKSISNLAKVKKNMIIITIICQKLANQIKTHSLVGKEKKTMVSLFKMSYLGLAFCSGAAIYMWLTFKFDEYHTPLYDLFIALTGGFQATTLTLLVESL